MYHMFWKGFWKNEKFINIHKHKVVEEVTQNIFYEHLKHSGGTSNGLTRVSNWPKGILRAVFHSSPLGILIKWFAFLRSSLEKILAPYRGLKRAEEIIGQGHLFLSGLFIQSSVVYEGSECFILLFHKEEPCSRRWGGWVYNNCNKLIVIRMVHGQREGFLFVELNHGTAGAREKGWEVLERDET